MRARSNDTLDAHVPERTCILSRRTAPREELIRLALSPDGQVAPDVRARAPGRGAWIGVGRQALDEANAKGKLKGALARAFKTGDVSVPADLGERVEAGRHRHVIDQVAPDDALVRFVKDLSQRARQVGIPARADRRHRAIR